MERNQWWKGEAPNFKEILETIKIVLINTIDTSLSTYTQKTNKAEAIAWIIKYFNPIFFNLLGPLPNNEQ